MRLQFSPEAIEDLDQETDYIAHNLASPQTAEKFFDSIFARCKLFAEVPSSAPHLRTLSGIQTPYQFMMYKEWMIVGKTHDDYVEILRILYAKSNYISLVLKEISEASEG